MKVGKYLHTRLRVNDMDRSVKFYTEVLGLELLERKTSPRGSQLVFLKMPGTQGELELCSFAESGGVDVPEDLVHLAFEVTHLEEWVARLEQHGVQLRREREGQHMSNRAERKLEDGADQEQQEREAEQRRRRRGTPLKPRRQCQ